MDSKAIIRTAEEKDVANLLELIVKATDGQTKLTEEILLQALFEPLKLLSEIKNNDPNIQIDSDLYKTDSTSARAIVAEVDKKLVGFILSHYYYSPWPGNCYQIDKVYVEPKFRLKGIARRLMDLLKVIAKSENIKQFFFSKYKPEDIDIMSRVTGASVRVLRDDSKDWSVLRIDFRE